MYNVEKYVAKCLDSVLQQKNISASQFEVIVVNDGSKDSSLQIAQTYLDMFDHFTIINQSNQGLSAARNAGLDIAKGEYVWFIDSDDWIADNALEIILSKINSDAPELIHFRAANMIGEKLVERGKPFENIDKIYSGADIFIHGYWEPCAPFNIYKRELLNNNGLRFLTGVFHEDNEFTPRLLYYTKQACLLNDVLYYVYQNPNSITRTLNHKKSFDLIVVANSLFNFCSQNVHEKKMKILLYNFISLSLNNALHGATFMDDDTKHRFNTELKKQEHLFKCLRQSSILKYKIEGWLFGFSSNYTAIYDLMLKFKA